MSKTTTIIAPAYSKLDVISELLKNSDLLMGTEIVPLNVFRSNLVSYLGTQTAEFSRLFRKVQHNISHTNIYYESLKYPAFFGYFYDFINTLNRLNINVDTLPDDDRKEILQWLNRQQLISRKMQKALLAIEDASNIEIYDYFYGDIADRRDIEYLLSKGARLISLNKPEHQLAEVRYGHNTSQEISAIAQYIVEKILNRDLEPQDITILVNDLENTAPVIEQIFGLYNIPFSIARNSHSEAARAFISLLRYVSSPNTEKFAEAYNNSCFGKPDPVLISYINYFRLTNAQLYEPFDHVAGWQNDYPLVTDVNTYETMSVSETECEEIMSQVRPVLQELSQYSTLKERTAAIFNYLKDLPFDEEERQCLDEIRTLCLESVPYLPDDSEGYRTLYYHLDSIRKVNKERYLNAVTISDVCRNVSSCKLAIITGCSQDVFPAAVNQTGFFDEYYLKNIPDYPSLDERTACFDRQLNSLLSQIPHLILSYSTNDLEGNKLYSSTDLDKYGKHQPWPYKENSRYQDRKQSISEKTAADIYLTGPKRIRDLKEEYRKTYGKQLNVDPFHDRVLTASPSSLESYVSCPFKYFLEKGLRLEAGNWFEIDAGVIGNIQHRSLQAYYENGTPVENSVRSCFDAIRKLLVNDSEYINSVEERLLTSLMIKMQFLDEAVRQARWKPAEYEKKIIKAEDFGSHKVIINGFIDRLDKSADEFMIVDYKSSRKSVTEESISNGTRIQLLTYLLAYAELQNEFRPFGMAYYNLKNGFAEYKKTEGLDERRNVTDTRWKDNRYDLFMAKGNSTDDPHYATLRKYTPDLELWKKGLRDIVGILSSRILSGDISITPTKFACDYCDYKDICHSYQSDEEVKRKPLINLEDYKDDNPA
ncbi:MAG: exodeoxyribonuclease V subunit gamma [Erysipelotrichaceae bacterium]|nr:exodeoxyribonuclease V subunit gamma [Erysipelotrichaceae bacterium]